jgi:hypothetical protein
MKTHNTAGERMARLEEKTDNIECMVTSINKKLDDFIACAPRQFSGKWVETGFSWGLTIIVGGVLAALLALVIK